MAIVTSLLVELIDAKVRVTRRERMTTLQLAIAIVVPTRVSRIPFSTEVNPIGDDAVLRPNFRGFGPISVFKSDPHFGRLGPLDSRREDKHIPHLNPVRLEMGFDFVRGHRW